MTGSESKLLDSVDGLAGHARGLVDSAVEAIRDGHDCRAIEALLDLEVTVSSMGRLHRALMVRRHAALRDNKEQG